MIKYFCSDGSRISEAGIQRRYSQSLQSKYGTMTVAPVCECCGRARSVHSDHTIARARCKVIRKTELIWDGDNYVRSCEQCHRAWENFKSGEWTLHINCVQRLAYLKEHDPEGFTIRVTLTSSALNEEMNKAIERHKEILQITDEDNRQDQVG